MSSQWIKENRMISRKAYQAIVNAIHYRVLCNDCGYIHVAITSAKLFNGDMINGDCPYCNSTWATVIREF